MEHNPDGPTVPMIHALPDPCNDKATGAKGRPYDGWGGKPLTQPERVKVNDILAACNDPVDWDTLTKLATSGGGFLDDEVRQVACRLTNHLSLITL